MSRIADENVLVLDFGSQYAQLIARRVRQQDVYCRIVRHDISAERIRELAPMGLILSGGPSSVYEEGAPKCDPGIFSLGLPVLGICYGMQLACESKAATTEESTPPDSPQTTRRLPTWRLTRSMVSRAKSPSFHVPEQPQTSLRKLPRIFEPSGV